MNAPDNSNHPVVDAIDSLLSSEGVNTNGTQVAELLAVSLVQMVPREQRALCAMLTEKARCPLPLFEQMLIGDIDGLEHVVANASWLGTAHVQAVLRHGGRSPVLRALARRGDLGTDALRALRELNDESVDRALELRQTGPVNHPVVENPGPRITFEAPKPELSEAELLQFIAHAGEENSSFLATAISDRFEVGFQAVDSILRSDDVAAIAALIKFLGLGTEEAEQLFKSIRWRRYPDQAERTLFATRFDELTKEAVDQIVNDWVPVSASQATS